MRNCAEMFIFQMRMLLILQHFHKNGSHSQSEWGFTPTKGHHSLALFLVCVAFVAGLNCVKRKCTVNKLLNI